MNAAHILEGHVRSTAPHSHSIVPGALYIFDRSAPHDGHLYPASTLH